MGSEPHGSGAPQRGKKKISRAKGIKKRDQKEGKRRLAESRALKRETKRKEKVVRLKRELLRIAELGESGLVWRNQEQRPKGVQRIKKEEPSSPIIKIETPPSPTLEYPPTPPHRYESMPLS